MIAKLASQKFWPHGERCGLTRPSRLIILDPKRGLGNLLPRDFTRMNGLEELHPPAVRTSARWKRVALLVALFAVVFGARLWIVDDIGSSTPFWDQWNAEGMELFKPFLLGKLSWSNLFAPLNEHRIVLTRLLLLGLFRADGMWDPRLEMVVNAMIAAGTATLIAHLVLLEIGEAWLRPIVAAVAFLWVLPYGWESTVMGIQSLMYFLLLFSFTALWGLSHGPPFSTRWWIGLASLVLACLSMASGLLAGLAVAAIRCVAIALDRGTWRTHWLTMVSGLACAAITFLFAPHMRVHDELYAQGPQYFLAFLFKCLSWPALKIPFAFLLLQAPLFFTARNLVREKGRSPARCFLLALAIWGAMQSGALAYSRGDHGGSPSSRHQDALVIDFLASFIALLLEWPHINRWIRYFWVLLAVIGFVQSASHDLRRSLPEVRQSRIEQTRRCRAYVQSEDPAVLRNVSDRLDIPLGNPDKLAHYLDDPQVRSILLFVPGQEGRAGWPTQISNGLLKCSRAIFALGILGLITMLWLRPATRRDPGLQSGT
jgi:hypothetical protein